MQPKGILLLLVLLIFYHSLFAQQNAQPDRFQVLEQRLRDLSLTNIGLNETVDFAVSGASIQEFLKGLAKANQLNINVDPQLSIKVYNSFTNEKVANILLFLAREYDLDIRFVGSIMSFSRFIAPVVTAPYVPKEMAIRYDAYRNALSMNLQQDSLSAVVQKLTQVTRKNVIMAPGLGGKLLSVYIEDLPLDNAMEKMAFANGLKVSKTTDNVFVIQNPAEGEVSDLIASTNTVARNNKRDAAVKPNRPVGGNPEVTPQIYVEVLDTLGKKYISLDATGAPIIDVLQAVSEQIGVSYFLYSDVKGNTTTKVNRVLFDELLTYLLQGTNYTFKSDQKIYLIGDRQLEGLRANKVFQFQYRSLDTMQDVIPAELKKGVEIKEFKELNSVLLTGSLPQINEIEAFLKQLDRVVPLIMIEVIMMDVRKGKSISTGIKAGIADSSAHTGGTLLSGLNFTLSGNSINDFLSRIGLNNVLNIGRVNPNFYLNLSALEQNNNVELRQIPKLSTLNGHEAKLSIGSTRYYSQKTQNVLGSLNPQTVITEQFNAVQANLAINIQPIVAGDDQVTLNIDVNISDFIGDPPANSPPPTSTSQFKSMLRVRNEEMIVLGGLERTEKSENGSGIPLLSRIPIIKWLFSSRTRSTSKVVSVVFIKPTIIY